MYEPSTNSPRTVFRERFRGLFGWPECPVLRDVSAVEKASTPPSRLLKTRRRRPGPSCRTSRRGSRRFGSERSHRSKLLPFFGAGNTLVRPGVLSRVQPLSNGAALHWSNGENEQEMRFGRHSLGVLKNIPIGNKQPRSTRWVSRPSGRAALTDFRLPRRPRALSPVLYPGRPAARRRPRPCPVQALV